MNSKTCNTCVVGIGSLQGNDAVGWRVAEALGPLLPASVQVVTLSEPTRLIPLFDEYARVWIVDACRSAQPLGTITRFVWPDDRIDRRWTLSGHGVGLAEVLELASTLGSIPSKTVVYTIDIGPEPSSPNSQMTPQVAAAAELLRARLVDEVLANSNRPSNASTSAPPHSSFSGSTR